MGTGSAGCRVFGLKAEAITAASALGLAYLMKLSTGVSSDSIC